MWGERFWPIFLITFAIVGGAAETLALIFSPRNTLSFWVWNALKVQRDMNPWNWSATMFLIFGFWVLVVSWLTFHFFFHRFT